MQRLMAAAILAALLCTSAMAQEIEWHGYLDFRAVLPADESGWIDGGLGKSRFGAGDEGLRLGGAALQGIWQWTPELLAVADLQYAADGEQELDVLDAWLRYRPVSTTPWRWSTKLGVFFPPISLENEGVGWTSLWTVTPSAINSWVGEELRVIGAEARLEHRTEHSSHEAAVALFGRNSPAGELLAARGWSLSDLTAGLGADLREPDVYAPLASGSVPLTFPPFIDIADRIGWYAHLRSDWPGYGQLSLLRYDNRANPRRFVDVDDRHVYAWHTTFWSLGAQSQIGEVALLGQVMDGSTLFTPGANLSLVTDFSAGYLLAGWERITWQPALRVDWFRTRQRPDTLGAPLSEHGRATTLALNWRPRAWLRITGEWLRIDSHRDQRRLQGLPPRQIDNQLQVSARLLF